MAQQGKRSKATKDEQRKEEVEKVILKNIPSEQLTWIKQPVNITMMRGDLDGISLRYLVAIMEKLQPRINEWLAFENARKELQPSLFSEEEIVKMTLEASQGDLSKTTIPPVRLQLSSLGISAQHYDRLEKALDILYNQSFEFTYREDNEIRQIRAHLLQAVSFPKKVVKEGAKAHTPKRSSYVDIYLSPVAMRYGLQMKQYNRYIKSAVFDLKGKFTARLYMMITAYNFGKYKEWTVDYVELRRILGVDKMARNGAWEIDKYPEYRDFNRRVLKDSQIELEELAKNGGVDCYFEYEEIRPGERKRGCPEKIRFIIHQSEMGKAEEEKLHSSANFMSLYPLLTENFGFTEKESKRIINMIGDIPVADVKEKIASIRKSIDRNGKVENVKGYANKVLTEWLTERIEEPEEYTGPQEPSDEPVDVKVPVFEESKDMDALRKAWAKFKAAVMANWDEQLIAVWFRPLDQKWETYELEDNVLTISVPSAAFYEVMCQRVGEEHMNAVFSYLDYTVKFVISY